jgi:RimJ/RimL family protein N-acetyltransferase
MSVRTTFHTDRLTLRPLAAEDLEVLVAMNGDAEVMAYIGRPMSCDEVVAELPGWVDGDGTFGLWIGHTTDGFAGIWFLSRDPDDDTSGEIGWRLPRSAWGHGYAVEGARASVAHAFDTLGLERLWAETMAVNARSRRVMNRLGMTHVRTHVQEWEEPIDGWEQGEVVYELTRPAGDSGGSSPERIANTTS